MSQIFELLHVDFVANYYLSIIIAGNFTFSAVMTTL